MSTAVATTNNVKKIEKLLIQGDLGGLSEVERLEYYRQVCDSLNLNPLTKPFEYIELNKKLVLYATKNCTDQLRRINHVSITSIESKVAHGIYIVTAQASDGEGRQDTSTGAVSLEVEDGEWKTSSNGKRFFQKKWQVAST